MNKKNIKFLEQLTQEIGPSGQEFKVQRIFKEFVKQHSDDIIVSKLQSVIAHKKSSGKVKILFSGHSDEISMLVKYIDSNGFIYVSAMGGIDPILLPGQRVFIHHNEKKIMGVFGRKPKHLLKDSTSEIKLSDLWIDIGVNSKEEAEKKVSLGDVVSWEGKFHLFDDNHIISKALDNRVGVYIVARILEYLSKENIDADIYSLSSTQEEVGARGAKTAIAYVNPDIVVAIDVTFASDYPGMDEKENGDIKLGGGPVLTIGSRINPALLSLLKQVAIDNNIPVQIEVYPGRTGTDLDVLHEEGFGAAGLLVSIPCRYMHSPNEMVSFNDIESTVKLLSEFAKQVKDLDIINQI
ncbi:MAG: M42 family metallopeptidase [Candidatus Cloacimonetes bacterium]|nr:M42 family metallopeptidase [Candidatus Cloacimonadota bacterium]MDD4156960.1 M42 family metallopeptidase [Candidatus Cloacimonadota bacterium]